MQQQKDNNPFERQDSLAYQAKDPVPEEVPQAGQCPRCGSTRIRRPTRLLVINLAACAVSLSLTPLVCAMALVVLISFLALPVTTASAVVGRQRCLDCRHRFEPGRRDAVAVPRFPWRLHALNILVLFLLCIAGPFVMRVRAGAPVGGLPDMNADISRFFLFGMLLWGSLAWHLVLHHSLRRRVANPLVWAVLFLVPGVLGGGTLSFLSSPGSHIRTLLAYAQLAPLPQSATAVRFYAWSSPFSGEDFLRFTADPNDIERFLAESLALQGQEPTRYSAERMRLIYPKDFLARNVDDANEYVAPRTGGPAWYKQEIRGPARKYRIQPPKYQQPGEVLVDDETHTVYIRLCFS